MTKKSPLVSVLMPVFNAADFLRDAIKSILNQSFEHFEFIIIDDGSTDGSLEIVQQFDDVRIRLISLDINGGIIAALNLGLSLAKGKYLARMDADDIAFSNRLEQQVVFLERHSDIGCLGTNFQWLNEPSKKSWVRYYDAANIKVSLLFGCELCHPTVMFRMDKIRRYNLTYPENYPHAEDYGFWIKLSLYTKITNLSEPLLYYRRHEGQVSVAKNKVQSQSINSIHIAQLQRLGLSSISSAELMMHHVLGGAFIPFFRTKKVLNGWANKLLEANAATQILPNELLRMQVSKRIDESVLKNTVRLSKMSVLRQFHWQMSSTYRLFTAQKH